MVPQLLAIRNFKYLINQSITAQIEGWYIPSVQSGSRSLGDSADDWEVIELLNVAA